MLTMPAAECAEGFSSRRDQQMRSDPNPRPVFQSFILDTWSTQREYARDGYTLHYLYGHGTGSGSWGICHREIGQN
jgi:hypothetical protein